LVTNLTLRPIAFSCKSAPYLHEVLNSQIVPVIAMSWKEALRAPELTMERFTEVMAEAVRERLDMSVQVPASLVLHVYAKGNIICQCNLRGLWQKGIDGCDPEILREIDRVMNQ